HRRGLADPRSPPAPLPAGRPPGTPAGPRGGPPARSSRRRLSGTSRRVVPAARARPGGLAAHRDHADLAARRTPTAWFGARHDRGQLASGGLPPRGSPAVEEPAQCRRRARRALYDRPAASTVGADRWG